MMPATVPTAAMPIAMRAASVLAVKRGERPYGYM
ncbi:hypothetical protein CBOVI_07985 [Corynebacterium bovis DSM 20582 = CIP 54.80]|nr:hypothetical protein CBOVI_07985 [Corynebacterium bovis DSM 20582 = CIP 54.80]